jgi:hypothetical protein
MTNLLRLLALSTVAITAVLAYTDQTANMLPSYQSCGGRRTASVTCPGGQVCIDDPRKGGCGMKCDAPGICVKPVFCGGFAGIKCKDGKKCFDDPRDSCDPKRGGADCGGLCL